jgi:hypothetical protein
MVTTMVISLAGSSYHSHNGDVDVLDVEEPSSKVRKESDRVN